MAGWLETRWQPSLDAPRRRDREGGTYRCYLPDELVSRPLAITRSLAAHSARAEAAVHRVVSAPHSRGLEELARFLLRSEAIASSRIEGLQVSAQQVALAEFAQTEGGSRGFSENARLVANNIIALRHAATELAETASVTVNGVEALQRSLLPEHPHLGIRRVQNWIGGSNWQPLDAEFVPPPADRVEGLLTDLVEYIGSAAHAPLIQAGLVHAQFETIHPFVDGNGRVGRALIHTVLTRRGLTRTAVLPVSLVLLTRSTEYVNGLTAYRYDGAVDSHASRDGIEHWLTVFLRAVEVAAEQASRFAEDLADLRAEWQERHIAYRTGHGLRQRPRTDSAVARLLDVLPEVPLVTARTVQRMLDVSRPAARAAVEELAEARILSRKRLEGGTVGYLARDVFDLLTFAERRLASTRWDTRTASPGRPSPARPTS